MVKFKCLLTNLFYEFEAAVDIEAMRKHPEYKEVTEEVKTEDPKKQKTVKE